MNYNFHNKQNLYTSGEFAKMAKVTIRTIRYYDKQGLLKPTFINDSGYRMYTDADFLRLQKILSLKLLGFSLQEISGMIVEKENEDIANSLRLQQKLVEQKIDQLQSMNAALMSTVDLVEKTNEIDWNGILKLIHLTNMEKNIIGQYKNGTNINIRIALHEQYSVNQTGWFPWLFCQLDWKKAHEVMELGCGNGKLWTIPDTRILNENHHIYVTDSSEGMLLEAKGNIHKEQEQIKGTSQFCFRVVDCEKIPYESESFDVVIANHLMFYVKNRSRAFHEINRVLKKDGTFYCSTYGKKHMMEITQLVQEFDSRVVLSEVPLYEEFGIENGSEQLAPFFKEVIFMPYEDELHVNRVEPILQYILSCHGNQMGLLNQRVSEFRSFLQKKLDRLGYFHISKEAGVFICKK